MDTFFLQFCPAFAGAGGTPLPCTPCPPPALNPSSCMQCPGRLFSGSQLLASLPGLHLMPRPFWQCPRP